jgi:hypothetical protein
MPKQQDRTGAQGTTGAATGSVAERFATPIETSDAVNPDAKSAEQFTPPPAPERKAKRPR